MIEKPDKKSLLYYRMMKKYILFLIIFSQLLTGAAFAVGESPLLGAEREPLIFVNNRILATVNGKAISVIDVMKKMDMQFYKQYPQYTSSVTARFQFYQISWKHVLQELIDKELVMADAEEAKVVVSGGDVRQEMESMFGPNIILNLDKVGLTFEEAWKMVEADLILRRLMSYRVHAKAVRDVTPQKVRTAYEEYAKANIRPEEWQYIVISIRNPDPSQAAEAAHIAYRYLVDEHQPLANLSAKISDISAIGSSTKVTVSETFKHVEKDLSPAYKEPLSKLQPDTYSEPLAQKSRTDSKNAVFRIFYLKEHTPEGFVPFAEVEVKLKNKLIEEAIDKETEAYLKKLREHHHVQDSQIAELTSGDFQPFVLK